MLLQVRVLKDRSAVEQGRGVHRLGAADVRMRRADSLKAALATPGGMITRGYFWPTIVALQIALPRPRKTAFFAVGPASHAAAPTLGTSAAGDESRLLPSGRRAARVCGRRARGDQGEQAVVDKDAAPVRLLLASLLPAGGSRQQGREPRGGAARLGDPGAGGDLRGRRQ